jgi:hypothetical protein
MRRMTGRRLIRLANTPHRTRTPKLKRLDPTIATASPYSEVVSNSVSCTRDRRRKIFRLAPHHRTAISNPVRLASHDRLIACPR